MEPRSQLIYRYMQVAVGMAVDMHLDTDPGIILRQTGLYAIESSLQHDCDMALNRSREFCRAALGCFYLSSV
jgi:hypothetical protein